MKYVLYSELADAIESTGETSRHRWGDLLATRLHIRDTADQDSPLTRHLHYDCGLAECGQWHHTPVNLDDG